MIAVLILSAFALIFLWTAFHRYRHEPLMLTAGLVSAIGGIGGVALGIPQVLFRVPPPVLLTVGGAAVVMAVGGSIYAERRYRELGLDPTRVPARRADRRR